MSKQSEPTKKLGRPIKLDEEIIVKLEEAFKAGMSVREACWLADINRDTYYSWLKHHKDFSVRMEKAQGWLVMRAKKTMADAVRSNDPKASAWWLERKAKEEFSTKIVTEDDTEGGAEMAEARKMIVALVKGLNGRIADEKTTSSQELN